MNRILYKYLDSDGGLKMLEKGNLQFTNSTRLNDPFDCHPSLMDYSNVPSDNKEAWEREFFRDMAFNRNEQLRDSVWICSLSKVYNSLLMWSYYGNHQGVCIGIDMEKAKAYLSEVYCQLMIGAYEWEVQYKDIIEKPDFFHEFMDYLQYQVSTKAKEWEHEQEVRLALFNPSPIRTACRLPYKPKRGETIDWKEVRFYPIIGKECFDSIYLGIRIDKKMKEVIIDAAKRLNSQIKIYQMEPDPNAFRVKEILI